MPAVITKSEDEILDEIISDGSADVEQWAELNKQLIARLDNIAHKDFPQTRLPPPPPSIPVANATDFDIIDATPTQSAFQTPARPLGSHITSSLAAPQADTQDAPPASSDDVGSSPNLPPAPEVQPLAAPQRPPQTPPRNAAATEAADETLHPEDLAHLTSLSQTLSTQFADAPPYTIQRLAELLRNPTQHYKNLPKFLRAVQRVLSVSSGTTAFPLPQNAAEAAISSNGLLSNGSSNGFALGSDESLGGALLSPIPWLTPTSLTEDLVREGNAPGGIAQGLEAINGVSQGELLRQEQQLNIVPAAQVGSPPGMGEEHHQHQHQEGPPALGPEDVGPQPEGTVFSDLPKSPEMLMSPRLEVAEMARAAERMDEEMEDVKAEEKKDEDEGMGVVAAAKDDVKVGEPKEGDEAGQLAEESEKVEKDEDEIMAD